MSDRAVRIIEATKAGELLPRISENPDNWRCKACQWRARCWGDGHGSAR
jgi:CRISPR/Cas system-associated exonuclease Cas4 (RecB family)